MSSLINNAFVADAASVFSEIGIPATYVSTGGVACSSTVIFSQTADEFGGADITSFDSTSENQRLIALRKMDVDPTPGGIVQVAGQRFALVLRVYDDDVSSQWQVRQENG